jgi:hypothetical protein
MTQLEFDFTNGAVTAFTGEVGTAPAVEADEAAEVEDTPTDVEVASAGTKQTRAQKHYAPAGLEFGTV